MKTLLIALLILPLSALAGTNYQDSISLSSGLAAGSLQVTSNATVGGLVVTTNATVGGTLGVTGTITGPGSGITALNASSLSSGTVPNSVFPATLPAASGANLTALTLANVTGLSAQLALLAPIASPTFTGTITGNGSGLTSLNGANVTGSFSVAGSVKLTAQTSAIGATTILTAPTGGALYDVSVYCECTTISGTGAPTITVAIGWTDDNAAQSVNVISALSLAAKGYSTGAKAASTTPTSVWIPAGSTLTYTTTIASAAGSPQYALYIAAKRVM